MSPRPIAADDYAYPPDQQRLALAEADVLARQLTNLRSPHRFTMERIAHRRLAAAATWVPVASGNGQPDYVGNQGLVEDTDSTSGFRVVTAPPGQSSAVSPFAQLGAPAEAVVPNHVMALASSVMKGDTSPEPTERRLPFDPDRFAGDLSEESAARRPRVTVIDTGLTREIRDDAWLTGLGRSAANEDRLDGADDTPCHLDVGAGHGTFVAGIVQQVCPQADIAVLRALDSDGVGRESDVAEQMQIAAGVQRAAEGGYQPEPADVIVLCLGTQTANREQPLALQIALRKIEEQAPDVLIVAAAGNDGDETVTWPAAAENVIAVGGLTADGKPAEWSTRGDWVDCSAVGEGIVSTFVDGTETAAQGGSVFGPSSWAMWTGTSFCAPQIAGAVARVMASHPGSTPRQAYEALVADCEVVPGHGRLLTLLPGTPRPEGWTFPAGEPPATASA